MLSQPEGAEEPETNPSVPQQEEQPDTTDGKVIADYKLDIGYDSEGQALRSNQFIMKNKRITLMQNMQK